jgi:hypothetical protein
VPKRGIVTQWAVLPGAAFDVRVVVGARNQQALEEIAGCRKDEPACLTTVACLVGEPDNPIDPSAVAVVIQGSKVGYLGSGDAAKYGSIMDELLDKYAVGSACLAQLTGGWRHEDDETPFEVTLKLARAEELLGQHTLVALSVDDVLSGRLPEGE